MGSDNITAIMGLFEAQKNELQAYRQQAMDGQITPAQWELLSNGKLAATDAAVLEALGNLNRDELCNIAAVFIFRHFEELQNGEINSKSIELHIKRIRHLREVEAQKKEASVKNGSMGGKVKNYGTNQIKAWGIEKAKNMMGRPSQIARSLTMILPKEFKGLSDDPYNLIYKALLAEQKRQRGKV